MNNTAVSRSETPLSSFPLPFLCFLLRLWQTKSYLFLSFFSILFQPDASLKAGGRVWATVLLGVRAVSIRCCDRADKGDRSSGVSAPLCCCCCLFVVGGVASKEHQARSRLCSQKHCPVSSPSDAVNISSTHHPNDKTHCFHRHLWLVGR